MVSFEGGDGFLTTAAAATGDADDAPPPAYVTSVAATSVDARAVPVIPAPEDLIFFADVGGISSSGRGPVDEDDDVLLVSGTDNWGDDNGDDFDDEASRASTGTRSRWKSPRVGGLSIGKKNIGKKVSSLARGIAHRQPTTKGYDSRMGEERCKSKRRGSVSTPRSKSKQRPKPPPIVIEETDEHELSAKGNSPHVVKSPSAAEALLHMISPHTSATVGLTADESEDSEGAFVAIAGGAGASGMLDRATTGKRLSLEERRKVMPSDEAALPIVSENEYDAVTRESDTDNDPTEGNPYTSMDFSSPGTNLSRSSSPVNECHGDKEPDPDQENVNRGNINVNKDCAHGEKKGLLAKETQPKNAPGKAPEKTQHGGANEQSAQDNDVDTESDPSASSWRGKEILVRPRIIDLTPSMVSSDATVSTGGRRGGDRSKQMEGGEYSCKQQQKAADATFILHDIAAVTSPEGENEKRRTTSPPQDDNNIEVKQGVRPTTTEGLTILTTAMVEMSAGQTPQKSALLAKNCAGQTTPTPKGSAAAMTPTISNRSENNFGAASNMASPAGSVHRQVLMEMILQDIASTAGEHVSSPTSVRSEGPDAGDEEDSSRRQGSSVFSFEDESDAMASYSSARMVKEFKKELLPSLADSTLSPKQVRRGVTSCHQTGMGQMKQPSVLRVRSPASSAYSVGTAQTGTSKKKVSFSEQSDVRYYSQREGSMPTAISVEEEASTTSLDVGGRAAVYAPRQDLLLEQHEYDDADSSVLSAGDYYFYGGGNSRYRPQTVAACGAATATCNKEEEVDHDDFSQVVMKVLSDWRDMMGRHEAVIDALKQASGTKLECLQRRFQTGFQSGTAAQRKEDPGEYYQ